MQQKKKKAPSPSTPGCSVAGCPRRAYCKGICATHYQRSRRGADLAKPLQGTAPTPFQLWARVDVNTYDEFRRRARRAGVTTGTYLRELLTSIAQSEAA